jgi:hypothetical protein
MQAPAHRENVIQATGCFFIGQLMKRNQGIGLCAQCGWILKSQLVLILREFSVAIVPLFASYLAGSTADTFGDVDECGFDRNWRRWLAHTRS